VQVPTLALGPPLSHFGERDGGEKDKARADLIPVGHFSDRSDGMSLPLQTADLTSLWRHIASPLEVRSFISNWYQSRPESRLTCKDPPSMAYYVQEFSEGFCQERD